MQKGVLQLEDIKEGMKVTGKIKNVVDFGAFVDIGLHETGLVHLSELSDSFVENPMDVVKVGDVHEFTIIELDRDRRRIALSLKSDAASRAGTGQKSTVKRDAPAKRVVVVKKGGAASKGGFALRQAQGSDSSRSLNHRADRDDDGMSYNPFAAYFNKK
jgi:uncharacterized protein